MPLCVCVYIDLSPSLSLALSLSLSLSKYIYTAMQTLAEPKSWENTHNSKKKTYWSKEQCTCNILVMAKMLS